MAKASPFTSHDTSSAGEHEPRWSAALRGLRADALDCLQTTLAVLANDSYGCGSYLVLGCRYRLQVGSHDGMTFVRRSLRDRLDEAAEFLGLGAIGHWPETDRPGIRQLLRRWGPLYVVGEAYDMPWLPYAGRQCMPHSFLLAEGEHGYTVVDAYHNNTPWGPARPGIWTLGADDLDRVLAKTALAVALRPAASAPTIDPAAVLADNASRARLSGPEIERYVTAVQAQLDRPGAAERLTLDIWLLSRERLLFSTWLAGLECPSTTAAVADSCRQAEAWQQLATSSYVAMRRAQRGTAMAPSIVEDLGDRLRADAALVVGMANSVDRG